ncbi:MAG: TlpA family protein disulfide reductase [Gemmataceae bacterium]
MIWVITHPVESSAKESALAPQALELLLENHPNNNRLGTVCTALVFTIDPASEAFIRGVSTRSSLPENQARALASLAQNMKYRARLIQSLKDDPKLLQEYETKYGKPILQTLMKSNPDTLRAESRKAFQQVMDRHASMPHPSHGNLGNLAKAHLASLDKPITLDQPAPEIDAVDLFGKRLKLSDFRGKVVLLDFWGHQFAACQSMYSYQRKLVRRLAGKPFVLLGVNADPDRDGVRKRMERENLTWPSWWDGGNIGGPIASRWDIDHWPTLVLIDHRGIIRHLSLGWPDPKEADATIDQMVADVAKDNG